MPTIALLFTLHFGAAPSADRWIAPDKAKHFFTSAFLQSVSFSVLRSARVGKTGALIGATALTATVGVGKELYDARFGGDPSFRDLTADGAGIVAASLLLAHTER